LAAVFDRDHPNIEITRTSRSPHKVTFETEDHPSLANAQPVETAEFRVKRFHAAIAGVGVALKRFSDGGASAASIRSSVRSTPGR
jgi:hypothetical protein